MRREWVMLAEVFNPLKHKAEGTYVSDKLDGQRAIWLPTTRCMQFADVPFANTNRDLRDHVCTGLWTRYAKPIFAPEWFLDQLPDYPLDGELYLGLNSFQRLMSTVKRLEPVDTDWQNVGYYAFDIPNYRSVFQPGRINNPNFSRDIEMGAILKCGLDPTNPWYMPRRYEANYNYLSKRVSVVNPGELKGTWGLLKQDRLPLSQSIALSMIDKRLDGVLEKGGEGLILRSLHSEWQCKRTHELLKIKRVQDAEGTVVGFNYGTGKLHGLVGSIRINAKLGEKEITFDLSGFTDAEREVKIDYREEARVNPGAYTDKNVSVHFPLGNQITFTYRELTNDGRPKEARYYRPRID